MKKIASTLLFLISAFCAFSQNVGIGTVAPAFPLHVISSSTITGYFDNNTAANDGVWGVNSAPAGTGVGAGVIGITSQVSAFASGVYGENTNTNGTGVIGTGNNQNGVALTLGSGGSFVGTGTGVFGYANAATGSTGVVGSGNNIAPTTLTAGSGAAFTGLSTGVFSKVTGVSGGTNQCIYANNTALGTNVSVNAYNGVQQFKVLGNGSVSTIVKDIHNNRVILYAPESPEDYFQDFGQGQLVNGRAHIDLDPSFAKNVTINDKHPLRVFIQPEGDCKGTYVTNKTAAGFDVVELNGGHSNISFQWNITCNRADEQLANGFVSKNADARFGPAPAEEIQVTQKINTGGTKH